MTRYCLECGRPGLESDTRCWHCGAALPEPEEPAQTHGAKSTESPTGARPPSAKGRVYALIALCVFLAFVALTISLGRRPTAAINVRNGEQLWLQLTHPTERFVLEVPSDWEVIVAQDLASRRSLARQAVENPLFAQAIEPLGVLVDDFKFILSAEDGEALVAVGKSHLLGRLTAEQVIRNLRQAPPPALTLVQSELVSGHSENRTSASLDLVWAASQQRCRQEFIPLSDGAIIVAACAPEAQFAEFNELFETILNSFELVAI